MIIRLKLKYLNKTNERLHIMILPWSSIFNIIANHTQLELPNILYGMLRFNQTETSWESKMSLNIIAYLWKKIIIALT